MKLFCDSLNHAFSHSFSTLIVFNRIPASAPGSRAWAPHWSSIKKFIQSQYTILICIEPCHVVNVTFLKLDETNNAISIAV